MTTRYQGRAINGPFVGSWLAGESWLKAFPRGTYKHIRRDGKYVWVWTDADKQTYCDCCDKPRKTTRCWAYGIETFACWECRGLDEPDDEDE